MSHICCLPDKGEEIHEIRMQDGREERQEAVWDTEQVRGRSQASRQMWCRRFSLTAVILQPTEFHQWQLHLSCAVGQRPFQVSFLWQVDLLVLKFVQITRHSRKLSVCQKGLLAFFLRVESKRTHFKGERRKKRQPLKEVRMKMCLFLSKWRLT